MTYQMAAHGRRTDENYFIDHMGIAAGSSGLC